MKRFIPMCPHCGEADEDHNVIGICAHERAAIADTARAEGYAAGVSEERGRVVEWLRSSRAGICMALSDEDSDELALATGIARGEHEEKSE